MAMMTEPEPDSGHWERIKQELKCGLDRLTIEFERRIIVLYLPQGHCTDYTGATTYAERIFPDVLVIHVIAEGKRRYAYVKIDGKWVSKNIPEKTQRVLQ